MQDGKHAKGASIFRMAAQNADEPRTSARFGLGAASADLIAATNARNRGDGDHYLRMLGLDRMRVIRKLQAAGAIGQKKLPPGELAKEAE